MNQYAVLVSSRNRSGGTNGEFTTDIGSLGLGTSTTGFRVAVQHVQFVNSHYSINDRYYQIKFCEAGAPTTVLTATIAVGNYSYSTIAAAVTTAMDNAGTVAYTVTLDTITGKMTISAGTDFELKYVANSDSALGRLGFTAVGLDLGLAASYVSNAIVDLSGSKMLNIDIQELGHYGINGQVNTAFFSFPLLAGFGYVEAYHPQVLVWNPVRTRQMTRLSVRILDDEGKVYSAAENTDFVIQLVFSPIE